jgi:hypothetical protein
MFASDPSATATPLASSSSPRLAPRSCPYPPSPPASRPAAVSSYTMSLADVVGRSLETTRLRYIGRAKEVRLRMVNSLPTQGQAAHRSPGRPSAFLLQRVCGIGALTCLPEVGASSVQSSFARTVHARNP